MCNIHFTVISFSSSKRADICFSALTEIEVLQRINQKAALQYNKYDWFYTRKEHFLAMTSHRNAVSPLLRKDFNTDFIASVTRCRLILSWSKGRPKKQIITKYS